jgi:hypothetical protein
VNPFRNLRVNLLAKGGWAIIAVLSICITMLGIFGQGELAGRALTTLSTAALFAIGAMAMWPRD